MSELPVLDTTTVWTAEQIAKHNTEEDCWIVVDGKVYDVTLFLEDHPGGIDSITTHAGADATDDFEAVAHSKPAVEMMDKYQVGVAEENPDKPKKKAPSTASASASGGIGGTLLKIGLVVAVVGAYFMANTGKK